MNTLQRLDAKAQMRQQHHGHGEQRDQATRTFYNSLNAAQQKAFDSLPTAGHRKMHMRRMDAITQLPIRSSVPHQTTDLRVCFFMSAMGAHARQHRSRHCR